MRRVLVGAGFVIWVMGLSAVLGAKTEIRAATMSAAPPSGSWPAPRPPPPSPPPSSSFAPTTAPSPTTCTGGRTAHAMAIPQGKTGVIELVLTDQPASCKYWSAPPRTGCNSVGARISLPPALQKRGVYPLGGANGDFAYLDHQYTSSGGAWQTQPACNNGGGDLEGTLEITAITQNEIRGRICGSHTGNPSQNGLVDGTFVAKRCPACLMTGDSCTSDSQCCTNLCGGGTCDP